MYVFLTKILRNNSRPPIYVILHGAVSCKGYFALALVMCLLWPLATTHSKDVLLIHTFHFGVQLLAGIFCSGLPVWFLQLCWHTPSCATLYNSFEVHRWHHCDHQLLRHSWSAVSFLPHLFNCS